MLILFSVWTQKNNFKNAFLHIISLLLWNRHYIADLICVNQQFFFLLNTINYFFQNISVWISLLFLSFCMWPGSEFCVCVFFSFWFYRAKRRKGENTKENSQNPKTLSHFAFSHFRSVIIKRRQGANAKTRMDAPGFHMIVLIFSVHFKKHIKPIHV